MTKYLILSQKSIHFVEIMIKYVILLEAHCKEQLHVMVISLTIYHLEVYIGC